MGWFGLKRMLVFSALSAMVLGSVANAQKCCQPACNGSCSNAISADGSSPDIDTSSVASDFGSSSGPESIAPYMIGDYISSLTFSSSSQGPLSVGVRNFKFAENQSAVPMDRWFFNQSYFNDVGPSGGKETQIARYVTGKETTILDGQASIGVQIPLYYVNPSFNGTYSDGTADRAAFGDITLWFKNAFYNNNGDVFTGGAAWTLPTGSATVGGVPYTLPAGIQAPQHDGSIQPYLAGIRQLGGGVFFQGFSALDIPLDHSDSMFWFNDFQLGYIARTYNSSGITAIVPLVEIHSNSPWNRDIGGGLGYVSSLNFTTGVTLEINRASTLSLGLACPIQDNHTFDYEFLCQFNYFPRR